MRGAGARPPRGVGSRPLRIAEPAAGAVAALAEALARSRRPVFIAGRGARIAAARSELERLADACGALLATSAAARGLFRGSPWDLDVSGGFASPLAAELVRGADLVVGWGCALNMWTLRHGNLISPGTTVAQVDDDAAAIGAHRQVDLGVVGDVGVTARLASGLTASGPRQPAARLDGDGTGYRSAGLRDRIVPRDPLARRAVCGRRATITGSTRGR